MKVIEINFTDSDEKETFISTRTYIFNTNELNFCSYKRHLEYDAVSIDFDFKNIKFWGEVKGDFFDLDFCRFFEKKNPKRMVIRVLGHMEIK